MSRGIMNFKEWREFSRDITAGVFGGLVVACWQLSFELLNASSIWMKILLPSAITLIFLFFMFLFLKWIFIKNDGRTENDTIKQEILNKKGYDEKSLKIWQEVGEEEYLSRRNEWAQVDSKISSLLIIVLAIIGITIQYIDITKLVESQKVVYVFSLVLIGISFICCLAGLWPKRLDVINFEHNQDNDYKKELLVLKNQYDLAIKNQNSKLDNKLFFFKVSSIAFFFGLLLLVLIKLGVTF